jgi:hypothetical protein
LPRSTATPASLARTMMRSRFSTASSGVGFCIICALLPYRSL